MRLPLRMLAAQVFQQRVKGLEESRPTHVEKMRGSPAGPSMILPRVNYFLFTAV